jgi:outer membrane receptor protein involved in Fe transport
VTGALLAITWGALISPALATPRFDIPAQPLADSLRAVGSQTGTNILFDPSLVAGREAPALKADLTADQALSHLLADTGIRYEFLNESTVVLASRAGQSTIPAASSSTRSDNSASPPDGKEGKSRSSEGFLVAQVDQRPPATASSVENAQAQNSSGQLYGNRLQEIVVTARKREENIDRVPISMAVLSHAEMQQRNIQDMSNIANVTPGIDNSNIGTNAMGNDNPISIRGIFSSAGYATTGIYIDDVPIQVRYTALNEWTTIPKVFDLDRVEVLRGPQGTLFGAGAQGGVIRFITPQPSLTASTGYVRAGLSTTDSGDPSYETGLVIGEPIIDDTLAFRVSAWHRRDGGWIYHESAVPGGFVYDNSNWADSDVVRGALTFAPNEHLRVTPSIYFQHLYLNDEPGFAPAMCRTPCDTYTQQYQDLNLQLSNIAGGHFVNPNLLQAPASDRFYLPALKIDLDLGAITGVSDTSYLERSSHAPVDWTTVLPSLVAGEAAWPQTAQYPILFDTALRQEVFSQEVRVQSSDSNARLQWTVGVFYARSEESTSLLIQPSGGFPPLGVPPGGLVYYGVEPGSVDKQLAGFGQITYQPISLLSVSAGVRIAHTEFTYSSYQSGPLAGGVPPASGQQSQKVVDPKLSINVQLDDNNLLYVSAARGSRIGGLNLPLIQADNCIKALKELGYADGQVPLTYNSDYLWSYELGSKNRLLGERLQIEASVFHIDWSNIQQTVGVPDCYSAFTSNLGKAFSNGADLVINALVSDSVKLGLSAGYTNAKNNTTVVSGNVESVTSGDQINEFAAPWTLVPSVEYHNRGPGRSSIYLRVEGVYRSKNPGPFAAQHPNNAAYSTTFVPNPSTKVLNGHVGATWAQWDVSLFAMNILNTHPVLFNGQYEFPGPPASAQTLQPRTLGVTTTYSW